VYTTPNRPTGGAHGEKGPYRGVKGALLIVKGRIKGPMLVKMTVVVQEGDDARKLRANCCSLCWAHLGLLLEEI